MSDPVRPLGGAEPEVVVLRAVEGRPHAPHVLVEAAADRREMPQVAEGEQQLGRPAGLELGRVRPVIGTDLVLVAVDEVGIGMGVEMDRQVCQGVGDEEVVVSRAGRGIRPAPRRPRALVAAEMLPFSRRSMIRIRPSDPDQFVQLVAHPRIGAGVVDEDQLPAGDRSGRSRSGSSPGARRSADCRPARGSRTAARDRAGAGPPRSAGGGGDCPGSPRRQAS